jgi:hypothetical protein
MVYLFKRYMNCTRIVNKYAFNEYGWRALFALVPFSVVLTQDLCNGLAQQKSPIGSVAFFCFVSLDL